ncbi:MAG: FAD-dependent oxidoreductase [Gemmatimonadetes bacterium]|nr:FAD-dependent oxidoreductase [Gemmatimonadota bacterium]
MSGAPGRPSRFFVAGVTLGKKGEIIVNELLQTANLDIYAAGDVIGDPHRQPSPL